MVDPRVLEVVLINQKFNSTSEYVFFLNFGNVNFEWVATNQYAFSDSLSAHSTFFFHYTFFFVPDMGLFFTQLLISDSPHLHIDLHYSIIMYLFLHFCDLRFSTKFLA